jgi:predicted Zn-dependent protease with MMP-like domain
MAHAEVEHVRQNLPGPLQKEAVSLPVTYERTPTPEMIASGIPEDTLGLFIGTPFPDSESGVADLPPQVVLFLQGLWEVTGENKSRYREEVRRTYLHELGHYLGLDENELFDRDLD